MIHVILWDGDRNAPIRYYDEDVFNLANLIRNCNILSYTLDADDICIYCNKEKHGIDAHRDF